MPLWGQEKKARDEIFRLHLLGKNVLHECLHIAFDDMQLPVQSLTVCQAMAICIALLLAEKGMSWLDCQEA